MSKTKIPKGMTEKEVLNVIEEVISSLAYKFKFGYHSIEDMKQQARLYAWEGLDKFERPDKPCKTCPFNAYIVDTDECTEYNDKMECHLYNGWINRNESKRNI